MIGFFSCNLRRGGAKCAASPSVTASHVVGWLERAQHGFVHTAPIMFSSDWDARFSFFLVWLFTLCFKCAHYRIPV